MFRDRPGGNSSPVPHVEPLEPRQLLAVPAGFVADGDVGAGGGEAAGGQVLPTLPDVGGAIWPLGGGLGSGPDGKLYVGVGEHQQPAIAQSLAPPFGKILRMNADGSFPADNPF